MGNLEKAGVLVVVALLAVILVVAFLNFPEQNAKSPPVLGASVGKLSQAADGKAGKPKGENVYPVVDSAPPEFIRPKPDASRLVSDDAPRVNEVTPPAPTPAPPAPSFAKDPKIEDAALNKPVSVPPAATGYPKTVKVMNGESLWMIAVREYGPKAGPRMVAAITDANPKVRADVLKAGTELKLPAPPSDVADVKPKNEADKKPAASPGTSVKAQPAAVKPTRKLPFVPN